MISIVKISNFAELGWTSEKSPQSLGLLPKLMRI